MATVTKDAPKPKKTTQLGFPQIALAFAGIIKEIGLPGFIVVFVCTIFFSYGSDTQKTEFIDKFILLKGISENPAPFGIIVVALIFCNVLQHIYYSSRLKVAKEENERVLKHNDGLEKKLLGTEKKSSQKSK